MIRIQNKLEVLNGNKILVPGCEPTSAFTSPTLAENRDCKASVVDLQDALNAIPNATIIYMSNPRKKFLVLPEGPAPGPSNCTDCKYVEDYYQLLRDIGTEIEVDTLSSDRCEKPLSIGQICEAFPLKGIF